MPFLEIKANSDLSVKASNGQLPRTTNKDSFMGGEQSAI